MANQEQLEILKQGVDAWNKWRAENPFIEIDLREASLFESNLCDANLTGANLSDACLGKANLSGSDLGGANLVGSNLAGANLSRADLGSANLTRAHLADAKLVGTRLNGVDLIETDLVEANLAGANLIDVNCSQANFKNARIGLTNIGSTDLTDAFGLENVKHDAPSMIGTDALQLSKGKLPEKFLRGCGLSDWEIESAKLYNPDLTNEDIVKIQYRMFDFRATQALQISPLFISYSHADTDFVDHLDTSLTKKGVRFWRDIHDAKAGRLETQIDRAIRQNPTVLLILSKHSIKSDWVEHEVRKARELEKELGRDALCPIALDDGWKSSPWPERVMEQVMEYNILDFSGWKDKPTFESKFAKLLSGLEIFYKRPSA